jgi:PPK2 family polyphosphate:nucleotide phosphotransferase
MERYRIKPGSRVRLKDWDPEDTGGFDGDKQDGKQRLQELNDRLEELQERLYAEHRHKVLIVLQGMDTSGKDGVIRLVFDGVNPQGVKVAAFKVPTAEELDHDFLWRIHPKVPGRGEIVIFNRSHYEDLLVVRVHDLVPKRVWEPRFDQINQFERLLAESGTTILKFFLHIDKDEQKKRLEARLEDKNKRWKFRKGDLAERKRWNDYVEAYEDVLTKCSTDWASWYVVPSNAKWYRNLVIATVVVEALERLDPRYPEPEEDLDGVTVK